MKNIKSYITNYEYKVLYKRIFYTCIIMIIFILGTKIPLLPVTADTTGKGSLSSILTSSMGGDFNNLNIFTLGLGPWLTAMILIMIFSYRDVDKNAKQTRKEKSYREKFLTLFIAVIQAFYLVSQYFNQGHISSEKRYLVILILITGTMLLIWLADQNTQKGIGGPMPIVLMSMIKAMFQNDTFELHGNSGIIMLIIGVLIISFIILMFLELTEYRIDYVDIMNISKQYNNTYLSWKFNPAGSLSIMVSIALFTLLNTLSNLVMLNVLNMKKHDLNILTFSDPVGVALYIILQLIFSYMLSRVILNTNQKAKDFKKSGNYIAGVRPGEDTKRFLGKRAMIICWIGSIIITSLIGIPLIIGLMLPKFSQEIQLTIQLIILVYIGLNLAETIKAYLYFDKYKSFMKKYW